MTPTDTRRTATMTQRRGSVLGAVLCLAVAGGVAAEVAPRVAIPRHVARLHLVNPTEYQLNVDVRAGTGGGSLDLGTIGRERSKTVHEVTDQGRRWVFRYSFAGFNAGGVVVTRRELDEAGWSVRIPEEVGHRLRDAGYSPSAL